MPVLAVTKERRAGETRVAVTPDSAKKLIALGFDVVVEMGAGLTASMPDADYAAAGAKIVATPDEALSAADLVLKVRAPADEEIAALKSGAIVVGLLNPFQDREPVEDMAAKGATVFAMEFVPRITRAQVMDALSSQANLAGYRSVIEAAETYGRALPMMMTAAGTVAPAKVFVMGAGVAGLQAIATARRLGAMVEGYDVRAAAREQVESLGARFVDTGVSAEGSGGYARELTAEEKQKQQDVLAKHVAQADAVITTAAIPGLPAPKILSRAMVEAMKPGALVVDLAAESGGNCELTQPGKTVVEGGVTILGPTNLPGDVPFHASQMFAKNLQAFLELLVDKTGAMVSAFTDEILAASLVTHAGEVVHAPTKEALAGAKA